MDLYAADTRVAALAGATAPVPDSPLLKLRTSKMAASKFDVGKKDSGHSTINDRYPWNGWTAERAS